MTLVNYGDEMRFAVMADAELAPEYTIIVSQYQSFIQQLAEEAENYSPEFGEYEHEKTTELWQPVWKFASMINHQRRAFV